MAVVGQVVVVPVVAHSLAPMELMAWVVVAAVEH
jgi:hypothetical protein